MVEKKFSLMQFLYLTFCIDIAVVLYIGISDTQNNLPMNKMLIFPLTIVIIILTGIILISKLKNSCFERLLTSKYTLFFSLFFYFILLTLISLFSKAIPDNDHYAVYKGALYMAGLTEESNWEYFARCDNNIIPMLLLSVIIRINQLLGFSKPYVLPVLLNSLQVTIAMYCIYKLLDKRDKRKYSFVLPWVGMGFVIFFLPVIGHTQSVYTDAMSFSFGIVAYFVWTKAAQTTTRLKKLFLFCLSGFFWGVGAAIKMTVLISFIAVFCSSTVYGKLKSKWKHFLLVGIVIIAILLITREIANNQPCQELKDSHGLPATYWIGIGILGNGGYADNQEYSIHLNTIWGIREKADFSQRYIKSHLSNFADLEHIYAKARHNFASGNLGSSDFMRMTEHRNFFYECISTDGKYFWRFCMINASLFYAMLLFIMAGILSEWKNLRKGMKADELFSVTVFTVIGIGIYLMLFEANNRQLYNHYSWYVIGAVSGMDALLKNLDIWRVRYGNFRQNI